MNVMRGSLQKEQTDTNISDLKKKNTKRNWHKNILNSVATGENHATQQRHTPVTAERFI